MSASGSLSPNTDYFELPSDHLGMHLGVWVTKPPGYKRRVNAGFPVVYATDGNHNALLYAAASYLLLGDALRPMRRYLQVSVGYTAADVKRFNVLRMRELRPPNEPTSDRLRQHIEGPRYASALGDDGVEGFMRHAAEGRADKFLAFFQHELHPEIERRYQVEPGPASLFGHSAGGLFTLYAFTTACPMFDCFGASSPGLTAEHSTVFDLYESMLADPAAAGRAVRLHMVVNDQELLGPDPLYRTLGVGFTRFLDLLRTRPLPGLTLTSAITQGENHFSGTLDAYRSFIRACFRQGAAPGA